jgi:hypothetical protein
VAVGVGVGVGEVAVGWRLVLLAVRLLEDFGTVLVVVAVAVVVAVVVVAEEVVLMVLEAVVAGTGVAAVGVEPAVAVAVEGVPEPVDPDLGVIEIGAIEVVELTPVAEAMGGKVLLGLAASVVTFVPEVAVDVVDAKPVVAMVAVVVVSEGLVAGITLGLVVEPVAVEGLVVAGVFVLGEARVVAGTVAVGVGVGAGVGVGSSAKVTAMGSSVGPLVPICKISVTVLDILFKDTLLRFFFSPLSFFFDLPRPSSAAGGEEEVAPKGTPGGVAVGVGDGVGAGVGVGRETGVERETSAAVVASLEVSSPCFLCPKLIDNRLLSLFFLLSPPSLASTEALSFSFSLSLLSASLFSLASLFLSSFSSFVSLSFSKLCESLRLRRFAIFPPPSLLLSVISFFSSFSSFLSSEALNADLESLLMRLPLDLLSSVTLSDFLSSLSLALPSFLVLFLFDDSFGDSGVT